jgi:hypothetical protein
MPTCREESGQGKERSVWAGLLVRGIHREREKREKGQALLKKKSNVAQSLKPSRCLREKEKKK